MNNQAKCCCGSTVVEIKGRPEIASVCHCNDCKRRTGSGLGWSVYVLKENFKHLTGSVVAYVIENSEQYGRQERYFCEVCGTTLFWRASGAAHLVGIAGGCFEDKEIILPQMQTNVDSKLCWVRVDVGARTQTKIDCAQS